MIWDKEKHPCHPAGPKRTSGMRCFPPRCKEFPSAGLRCQESLGARLTSSFNSSQLQQFWLLRGRAHGGQARAHLWEPGALHSGKGPGHWGNRPRRESGGSGTGRITDKSRQKREKRPQRADRTAAWTGKERSPQGPYENESRHRARSEPSQQ